MPQVAEPTLEFLRRQNEALAGENARLKGGGGGGTSDGMDGRLAKLEAQMEHVQADLAKLASVPADIAGLKVQVDNLPTKDFLSTQLDKQLRNTGVVVAIIAALFGIFFKVIG